MADNSPCVILMISRLRPKADHDQFYELCRLMRNWLATQDEFRRYEVYTNGAQVAGKILFRDRESAERVTEAFSRTEIARDMRKLLESGSQHFTGDVRDL